MPKRERTTEEKDERQKALEVAQAYGNAVRDTHRPLNGSDEDFNAFDAAQKALGPFQESASKKLENVGIPSSRIARILGRRRSSAQ